MHKTTAMIGTRDFGSFRFERRNGVCALIGPDGLEFSASADAGGRGLAGVDTLGQRALLAPTGAVEHSMSFRFRSRGLFAAEPGMHLALGLTGDWRKSDPNQNTFNGKVVGRGAIIGNVSGAPFGCPISPIVQLESFHRRGNRLVEGSGSVVLLDDHWYQMELTASLRGRMAYRVSNDANELLSAAEDDDAGADVENGLGGWWITHVFSDKAPHIDWSFDINDLRVSWL
ncbi:MAG: hypothetical protein R3F01_09610 [Lysobacteraceae bacterium]